MDLNYWKWKEWKRIAINRNLYGNRRIRIWVRRNQVSWSCFLGGVMQINQLDCLQNPTSGGAMPCKILVCRIHGMMEWLNDGMVELWNDELMEWWNDGRIEWWNNGMLKWWNDALGEWPYDSFDCLLFLLWPNMLLSCWLWTWIQQSLM